MTLRACTFPGCGRIAVRGTSRYCGICGRPLHVDPTDPAVVDHIVPRALGGTDHPTNLQAAHRSCNAAKSAKLLPNTDRGGSVT